MSVRSILNQNAAVSTIVVVVVLMLSLFMLYRTATGQPDPQPPLIYFSIDEGQSFFAADRANVPPWNHDGSEAVKAYVFSCGDREDPFVGYIEKFTPEAKERLEQAIADPDRDISDVTEDFTGQETLIKAPGDSRWLPVRSSEAVRLRQVRCSNGEMAQAMLPRDQ